MKLYTTKGSSLALTLCLIVYFSVVPFQEGMAEEDLWKLPPIPTIEELTDGKVKVGDTITKENVDLVKDLLSVAMYELVKQGLVMDIVENGVPGELIPEYFRKATEEAYKAVGRPTVTEEGVVWTKDGKPWPGGRPFTHTENAYEIMANAKYGECMDDDDIDVQMSLINKGGKAYKNIDSLVLQYWYNTRESMDPVGAVPGSEHIYKKMVLGFASPRDVRGLGQFSIRHWDDEDNPDEGFMYIPAFKRTIRISATTWQDPAGGGDNTYGDIEGLYEPYSYWNFKLLDSKPMLTSAPTDKSISIPGTRDLDLSQFITGQKYHRDTWQVDNYHVVEATPRIKHLYSKKVLYLQPDTTYVGITGFDAYDSAGQLWKGMIISRELEWPKDRRDQLFKGMDMMAYYDLQTGHSSVNYGTHRPNVGLDPSSITLQKLLKLGR